MRQAYPVAAVRAAEGELMRTVPEPQLMSIAADGLARVARRVMVDRGRRVLALVGSGNNGGDVLFAAARLAVRGAAVTAVHVGKTWHGAGAAALLRSGGRLVPAGDPQALRAAAAADLVLDGIVGIGATGPLREPAADLVARSRHATVIAADIPSGVDPDTGAVPDPRRAVRADLTVTFGCLKPGLVLPPGRGSAGTVELVDIGLGPALERQRPRVSVLDADDAAPRFAPLGDDDYKYSHGVVGVVAGSRKYPGAAHMVVGAARHCRVGMVRLHAGADRCDAAEAVVTRFPDVVISTSSPSSDRRVTAWAAGPGMGTGPAAVEALQSVLASSHPVVLDADALTVLARDPRMRGMVRDREPTTVLTPHLGEFERLGYTVGADRVAAVRAAAADCGAVVVLKGPGTLIADPDGSVFVDMMGTAALATAGTGDVLSGIIGAVLARQHGGADAAAVAAAVFLHGLAGRIAGRGGTPVAAWDVVKAVPMAVAELSG